MAEPKPVILIVEDDLDVAEMVNAYFNVQGYEVRTVNWGEDAVRSCQASPPDLVILDIRLPDIDGFEVAYRLRNNRKTKEIPIIFLTEKRARSDRLQGLELGADDYITKPFDVQELRLRVRNALRRSTQGTLTNPVTNLPEGVLVEERLQDCLKNNEWAIILVSLRNLEKFRETYGFVAADDVLRAVNLMVHNAVREVGGTSDFIGHLTPDDFVLVTSLQNLAALHERIQTRLEQSLDYFYPLKDRERRHLKEGRLKLDVRQVTASDGPFKSLAGLKAKLLQ
ncbi:MAG TPA: response regulator [Anaerolineales bacterium]|nr:response regulator [Anaerolineales bacterium]